MTRINPDFIRVHLWLNYWLTPLARKPPSTAMTSPLTKLAASEARKIAAPASSSTFPKRFIGVRSKNLRRAQRAGEIRVDNVVPVSLGKVECRRALRAARRVHEYVDFAKRADHFIEDVLQRRAIGNVRRQAQRAAPALFDLRGGRFDHVHATRRRHHVRARFRHSFGDGQPDAGRAADDDRDFVVEFETRIAHGQSVYTKIRFNNDPS